MSKNTILKLSDNRLRQISECVHVFDTDLENLAQEMIAKMEQARGIGLAAVQIGELKRVIVTCATNHEGDRDTYTLINPVITNRSEECSETDEGCLSIPGVRLTIRRPSTITVEYSDVKGLPHSLTATGMLATCIQHEVDHLDGILILDHVSKLKRDRAITAFKKATRFT